MSELFDRADALFVRKQMGGQAYVDSLQSELGVARSNLIALEQMKKRLGNSEIVDHKITLEKERIARIEEKLGLLGETLDSDDTNQDVVSILDPEVE